MAFFTAFVEHLASASKGAVRRFFCMKIVSSSLASNPPSREQRARVCAVVVAFNRCEMLRLCLAQLQLQSRPLDAILVVNNASTDDTAHMVKTEFPAVTLLDLPENGGGAGGFHAGMKHAFEQGFDWLWLMDDDVLASPDALEQMMRCSEEGDVLVPLQQDALERLYGVNLWAGRLVEVTKEVLSGKRPLGGRYAFAFAGPVISRQVIEKVGLPRAEFFIWFDDAEYSLRVHDAKLKIRIVPAAILRHDVGGNPKTVRFLNRTLVRIVPAPWKLYYGTRNMLYVLLRQKVSRRGRQRMLFQYGLSQLYQSALDLIYETPRLSRLQARLKGIKDGISGNLGKELNKP